MAEVDNIPRTVTMERIRQTLQSLGITTMVDDEEDVAVSIFPYLLYFVTEPSRPFLGISAFHRTLDVQYAAEASEFVIAHNSEFYAPKLYTVVSDEGKIRFRVSHCFNWDAGATSQQIEAELETFISATLDTMGRIDRAFPDTWGLEKS